MRRRAPLKRWVGEGKPPHRFRENPLIVDWQSPLLFGLCKTRLEAQRGGFCRSERCRHEFWEKNMKKILAVMGGGILDCTAWDGAVQPVE